jgi:hypothetical protein
VQELGNPRFIATSERLQSKERHRKQQNDAGREKIIASKRSWQQNELHPSTPFSRLVQPIQNSGK